MSNHDLWQCCKWWQPFVSCSKRPLWMTYFPISLRWKVDVSCTNQVWSDNYWPIILDITVHRLVHFMDIIEVETWLCITAKELRRDSVFSSSFKSQFDIQHIRLQQLIKRQRNLLQQTTTWTHLLQDGTMLKCSLWCFQLFHLSLIRQVRLRLHFQGRPEDIHIYKIIIKKVYKIMKWYWKTKLCI